MSEELDTRTQNDQPLNLDAFGADAAELRKFLSKPKGELAHDIHKLLIVKRNANAQDKERRMTIKRFEDVTGFDVEKTVDVFNKLSSGQVKYSELDDDEAEIALEFALTEQIDPAAVGIPEADMDSYIDYVQETIGGEDDGDDTTQSQPTTTDEVAALKRQLALRDKADELGIPKDRRDAFNALWKDPELAEDLDDKAKSKAIDEHTKGFRTKHSYLFETVAKTIPSTVAGGQINGGGNTVVEQAYQQAQSKGDIAGMLSMNKGEPMPSRGQPEKPE